MAMSCWLLQRKFLPGDVSWEHVFDSGALHGSATWHFSSILDRMGCYKLSELSSHPDICPSAANKRQRGEKMLKRVREQIPRQPLKEPVERTQQRVTSCACVREQPHVNFPLCFWVSFLSRLHSRGPRPFQSVLWEFAPISLFPSSVSGQTTAGNSSSPPPSEAHADRLLNGRGTSCPSRLHEVVSAPP